eukprot:6209674-Pleurochrysis_carterae.AAC.1
MALQQWLQDAGGTAAVAAARGAAGRAAPLQLKTTAYIAEDQPMLMVPSSRFISAESMLEEELKFLEKAFPEVIVPPFVLALGLLLHGAQGRDSKFHPLIKSLPSGAELRNLPSYMKPAERRMLKAGTPCPPRADFAGTDAFALASNLDQVQRTPTLAYMREASNLSFRRLLMRYPPHHLRHPRSLHRFVSLALIFPFSVCTQTGRFAKTLTHLHMRTGAPTRARRGIRESSRWREQMYTLTRTWEGPWAGLHTPMRTEAATWTEAAAERPIESTRQG